MTTTAAIADAIAQAQQAAATAVPSVPNSAANVPAVITPGGVPATPGKRMTLDDFTTGTLNVDAFLKVKEHGLQIGDSTALIESVLVEIDLSEVQVCEVVKFGNPATYLKTFDGVICHEGGTWEAAKMRAQQVDPKARPYKSADIPMTLLEPAKSLKGEEVQPAGTRLGHSLSTTNRANFATFLKDVTDAGYNPEQDTVQVKITAEPRTNKAGNRWGVLAFELLRPQQ